MATGTLLSDDAALTEDDAEQQPEVLPERFEIVNGQIVETSYMSNYANRVANNLKRVVDRYLDQHDIGETGIELLFHIPQPDDDGRNRRPDWSFVSYQRWPKDRPVSYRGNAWEVVPDIVAEIVSPTDDAQDLYEKVREYHRGGVRLAWIVYPVSREVHAYWAGSNQVRLYFAADELDAGDVLPGFGTPVAALFPPIEPAPPTPTT